MPDKSIMSWTVNKKLDNAIQWMIIPTDDLCNGKRMVRELCLCNDLSFYFLVMGKKVFKWNINEQELTKEFLDNVFEFCAMVPLCKGFEVEIEALAKDKQGYVICVTGQWEIVDQLGTKTQSLRHRSVKCSMICKEHESKCRNCENVRSNCHRKLKKKESSADEEQLGKKKS